MAPTLPPLPPKLDDFVVQHKVGLSAMAASVTSTLVAYPFDSVKTRQQTHHYKGVVDCVKTTYKNEKLGGFFRGVMAPLITITLVKTVSMSIYSKSKHTTSDFIKDCFGFDVFEHVCKKGTYPNIYTLACFGVSGAVTGSAITAIACPFELTKLSAQVSVNLMSDTKDSPERRRIASGYQNKGTVATMKEICKNRGLLGLYTGYKLHVYRDTLGSSLYFMVYESGKQIGQSLSGEHSLFGGATILASGGLCGILSMLITYPIDSSKAVYQKNSLVYLKGEKVPAAPKIQWFNRQLYRGLGMSFVKSFIVNGVFFGTFEFIKWKVKKMDGNDEKNS